MGMCADNRTSARTAIAAMEAGAHGMVEKPMAADLADAQTLWATAQYTQRMLMINWPTRWNPASYTLFRRAKTGEFGHIYEFRFRAVHAGPKESCPFRRKRCWNKPSSPLERALLLKAECPLNPTQQVALVCFIQPYIHAMSQRSVKHATFAVIATPRQQMVARLPCIRCAIVWVTV
ncbi:MAG: hypothetical protein C4336_03780 [Armatimonadota bacterium]